MVYAELIEKLQNLPEEKQAEVFDFVEFLAYQAKKLPPTKQFAATQISDVIGCTGYQGPARSLEEMATAITQGVSERCDRGRY